MAKRKRSGLERYFVKISPTLPSGCWIWTGSRDGTGYGMIWTEGRSLRAHIFGYRSLVGPVPQGLELDHLCRVPACVNPAHLEPVTHAENVRRGRTAEVNRARMALKTHCPHGHEYTEANTHRNAKGHRWCRACWAQKRLRQQHTTGTGG